MAAREAGMGTLGQGIVVLEEGIGPVRCGVEFGQGAPYAQFDLPVVASQTPRELDRDLLAAALSLDPVDIGFENHEPSVYNGGLDYTLVPVRDLDAAARAKPSDIATWRAAFGDGQHNCAYVYCRDTVLAEAQFHARMFGPDVGIHEDPATGSAAASFAGAVMEFDRPRDGLHTLIIEQGVEMGRPSAITLELEVSDRAMTGGRIGGRCVIVAEGTLAL